MKYHCYIDGSSRGNPGPGGWGLIIFNEDETEIVYTCGRQVDNVTNNHMELAAMLAALQYASEHPQDEFIIYSDSAYTVNSCNDWIWKWVANSWKNSRNAPVKNEDQMRGLYDYLSRPFFNAAIRKCNGHAGVMGNELADAIATNNEPEYNELCEFYSLNNYPFYQDC